MSVACTNAKLLRTLIIEHVLVPIKYQTELLWYIAKNKNQDVTDEVPVNSVVPEHAMLGAISEFGELLESSKRWKWWKTNDRNLEDTLNCLIELADIEHFTATTIIRLLVEPNTELDYPSDIPVQQFIDTITTFDGNKEAMLIKDYLIDYVKAVSNNDIQELLKLLGTKHRQLVYAYMYDAIKMIKEDIDTEIDLLDLEELYFDIVTLKHTYNINRQKQDYVKTNTARQLKLGNNLFEDNDLIKAYIIQRLLLLLTD